MQSEQHQLQQRLAVTAFREFARGQIPDHFMEFDGQYFVHHTVQLAFMSFLAGPSRVGGQQLYAGIKESSKYHNQAHWNVQQGYGHPFPVTFQPHPQGYVIKGGAHLQYRLEDVQLYAVHGGSLVQVA